MKKEEVVEWLVMAGTDWVDGFALYKLVPTAIVMTDEAVTYNITKWHKDGYVAISSKPAKIEYQDPEFKFKLTEKALKLLEEA